MSDPAIPPEARPRLPRGVRLVDSEAHGGKVLLAPERVFKADAVAAATPCCPAPVSAMIRVLPMRRASRIWPMQLLILCAPVWFSSSRLNQICAPIPAGADSRRASVSRSAK